MASASFAVVGVGVGGMDAGHAPASYSSSTPPQAHPSSHNNSNNSDRAHDETPSTGHENKKISGATPGSRRSTFDSHSHRQNHNSSKLPAFRFADLKKDTIAVPTLLQQSSVSPPPDTDNHSPDNQQPSQRQRRDAHDPAASQQIPGSQQDSLHTTAAQTQPDKTPSPETTQLTAARSRDPSPPKPPRASTFQPSTSTSTTKPDLSTGSKRPASFPDAPSVIANAHATRSQLPAAAATTPITKRRLTASSVALGADSLKRSANSSANTDDDSTNEWAQGQRDLLPRSLDPTKADDRKKSRPPVSYRPPAGARIPPIRGFRSSGSRKSLSLDAHTRRMSEESSGDDTTDPHQRDRTLRALEGLGDDDLSRITPPDSGNAMNDGDGDNTADLFMRIAREDTNQGQDERERPADPSAISRITRSAHRRPLSAAVPIFQATSPPQFTRRLSDQRETSRARPGTDSQAAQQITRELGYRSSVRERPTSNATVVDDSGRSQAQNRAPPPLRQSPVTPRQITFQDPAIEVSSTYRRRQSVTDNNNAGASTGRTYRNQNLAVGHSRMYNSSPLVPKTVDVQRNEPLQSIENHGVEGTESSASGGPAPSTVWDELDDLKSRMRRLELTGKAPSTSGAAMSRASDDRPPTATTNATTMSASPKRGTGANANQPDAVSTTSSHKEAQPLLLSALTKTKDLVAPDTFSAMETAANDAMALSAMMGAPGQPGPISSGVSTIGGTGGLTDRQLRRKADSICRSLTELYIALADEMSQLKGPQSAHAHGNREMERERELLASPTLKLPTSQRRPSVMVESAAATKPIMSPRAPTSLEQRRFSMLTSPNTLASPRFAMAPAAPAEPTGTGAGRKTSLLLSRTRRAGTEEPEEQPNGRKSSLLLRTRRAGTEEPEDNREGRKTSHMLRTRNITSDDEGEPRFRVPSRAITEVNVFRAGLHPAGAVASTQESDTLGSSALPRRRLVPSNLNTRLVAAAQSMTPTRRYLDRPTLNVEREPNAVPEKADEGRATRQFSLSQTAMLNRTSSINRRPRENLAANHSSQNAATGGNYR